MDYIIERIEGVQINHEKKVRHLFSANKLIHYPEGDTTHLEQVNLTSIEPDKPLLRTISDYAKLTEGSSDVFLKDHVSIIRGADTDPDKVTMLTDFLHLIPDTDEAKTDRPVTVLRMNSTVNAVGMIVNNQTGEILLQSRVVADDSRASRRSSQ